MSTEDIIGFIIDVIECLALVCVGLAIIRMNRTLAATRAVIEQNVTLRNALYAQLSDPNAIVADMEKGAVAMEALQAKRGRMIRDDAGPHARIWKPKIRSSIQGQLRKQADFGTSGDSDKE